MVRTLVWPYDVAMCSYNFHMLLWATCGKTQHYIKNQPFLYRRNCLYALDSAVLTVEPRDTQIRASGLQISIFHFINGYFGSE